MSLFHSNALIGAGSADVYEIQRSLRFNATDTAFLSRTPASAGNRKTWTLSTWVKLISTTGFLTLFGAGPSTANFDYLYINSGVLSFTSVVSPATTVDLISSFRLRDYSAWFHLVLSVDTTQAVAANRVRVYVNGTERVFGGANPSLNYDFNVNNTVAQVFGRQPSSANYFSGYLAECYLIDGQALTPSSFGEFDTNGIWQPKRYTGTYGTNGFQLKFADNSDTTATTLGKDTSPNGNNWTPTNFSVTAGAGNDSLVDSPTNYGTDTGVGGEVRGNYCTINPLQNRNNDTISNGNLEVTSSVASYGSHTSTIATPLSGKWYAEVTLGNNNGPASMFGLVNSSSNFTSTSYPGVLLGVAYDSSAGQKYVDLVQSSYGSAANLVSGDVIGIAYDAGAGTVTFYRNGTSIGLISGVPVRTYYFAGSDVNPGGSSALYIWNFGQRPWTYPANASGFKALCTQNLPEPTIVKPNNMMEAKLYTGNGSSQTISGLNFSPDLVWIKDRTTSGTFNCVFDTERGPYNVLLTSTADDQVSGAGTLTSFNSDGFSVGNSTQVNTTSAGIVAWTWDAGASGVTNTSGTITSRVRANPNAGFSIVTYTGNAINSTIGHGLNTTPSMIIVKSTSVYTSNWNVRHITIPATGNVILNASLAASTLTGAWNSTLPTSTVFSVGTSSATNGNNGTYVAYCFAPVDGYSAFGSYTGNGSADGPMIYTNMRPKWILLKRAFAAGNWEIFDSQRLGYNADNNALVPNNTNVELTTDLIDIVSNGFKIRTTSSAENSSGFVYLYAAFAETPFKYARAR